MREQDRLQKDLVDAMRRLRRRPVAVGAVGRRETVAPAGNVNPCQLLAGERGAIADVVRIVGGQSGIADLLGDAEPAEDFHGAGGDVVALRLRRCRAGTCFDHGDVDAAPCKIDGEGQPDRPRAYDQDVNFTVFLHAMRLFRLGA